MSTGTAGTTRSMHWVDWTLMGLFIAAVIVYTSVLIYWDYNDIYQIRWGAYIVFVIFGSAAFIGGYVLIRATDSRPGHWSGTEFFGVVLCVIGALLFVNGALPKYVSSTIEDMARHIQGLPDLDQPMVDVTRSVKADASEKFDVISINGLEPKVNGSAVTISGSPDKRVFVFLEIDPTKTSVKVPQGTHGKVWYSIDSRPSKADTF